VAESLLVYAHSSSWLLAQGLSIDLPTKFDASRFQAAPRSAHGRPAAMVRRDGGEAHY